MSGKDTLLSNTEVPDEVSSSVENVSDLFACANFHLKSQSRESEFDKSYRGTASEFDRMSFETLNVFPNKKKKQKQIQQVEDVENDIYEEEIFLRPIYRKFNMDIEETVPKEITSGINDKSGSQDNKEKMDRTLSIAEDFVMRKNIISVGKALWFYNGRFYEILTDESAQRQIYKRYREEIGKASPLSVLKNISGLLKVCCEVELEEFPLNEHLIVFENGTLDLQTGRFRENSAKDIASSALGIPYRPGCKDMRHTEKFLRSIADDDADLYERMLQAIGYVLSNDTRAKSFFYLEGVGNAGKSRFCDLVASFFPISGANAVSRIALQDLNGKYSLANLVNKKLNVSEDLPDAPLTTKTVSKIKMLSDSNRLEAEAKYVQAFSFSPTCKLLFASNHHIKIRAYDKAFVDRIVYIPFLKAIPEHKRDRNILEKNASRIAGFI